MNLTNYITNHTQLPQKSIENTIQLLNEDCTIPFISRYRKERTGNLDEVQIGEIVKFKTQFEVLEKRKATIVLEDLYLPYKKKRKTKAETAIKNGLEPLAKIIMSQRSDDIEYIASKYLNDTVQNEDEALEGARHIIAEWISERTDIRNNIRYQLDNYAVITTKVVSTKKEDEKAQKFRDYFDWSESLKRCPSHRLLAILRAENEGFIRVKIEIDSERALSKMEDRIIRSNNECADQIVIAIKDSYKRLLFPALSNERLKTAKEQADDDAIKVFSKNLKQLLLGAPLGEKRILAIDPGFRTGCKVVCLNAQGELKHNETIYPHGPQNKDKEAIKKISSLADAHKIEAIAIGNGTASRETERLIKRIAFKNPVEVFVVSEAGASIYSASKIAREEFPNYDVTVRGAVSIGRRLADPLAELVKIDAKSIGVGQYQHDVDQTKLKNSLDTVVESCVNTVGVNINTASASLLSYVSGIGPKLAENIVNHRNENGHPESYTIVKQMATNSNAAISDLIGNKGVLESIDLKNYTTETVGLPTLQDIIKELEKPGLDIREKAKMFTFDQNIRTITDLREGQLLPGIVNNITNFGCFVDIGIKESGLIHISNLSDTFVKDVNEHVSLHQQLIVKVLQVDIERKRIQLALHKKI